MTDVASILEKPRKSRASREEGVMSLSGCDHERATVGCGTCWRSSPHSLRENLDVLFVIFVLFGIFGMSWCSVIYIGGRLAGMQGFLVWRFNLQIKA